MVWHDMMPFLRNRESPNDWKRSLTVRSSRIGCISGDSHGPRVNECALACGQAKLNISIPGLWPVLSTQPPMSKHSQLALGSPALGSPVPVLGLDIICEGLRLFVVVVVIVRIIRRPHVFHLENITAFIAAFNRATLTQLRSEC